MGNLYTCLNCGTTRQSEPSTACNFFVLVFTAPNGAVAIGKAPPCPGRQLPNSTESVL